MSAAPFPMLRAALNPLPLALPFFTGKVSAGQSHFPSPAQDYELDELDLTKRFITNPPATFLMEVIGDSMIDIGIFPKSIIIVNRALTAKSSHIVVAVLDGEMMVKRLYKRGGVVKLLSENKTKGYPPIIPQEGQELLIWGVVTYVITPAI